MAGKRPAFVAEDVIKRSSAEYHIVIDFSNDRIIASSRYLHTIRTLIDNTLNSKAFYGVNKGLFKGKVSPEFDRLTPYLFTYKIGAGDIKLTSTPLSYEEKYYYALAAEKGFALDYLFIKLRDMRRPFQSDIPLQQDVYAIKYEQAVKFLQEENISPDRYELEFPFIQGYAEVEGYSMEIAAREIKLRREMFISRMAKIETQRQEYTNKIMACTDIREIKNIIHAFVDQGFNYGKM